MLYFAYGSNLNLRHMKRQAPRAKPLGRARLDGYTLVFRRFIDIAPETSGAVWGAVYEITPACERSLDSYEDFPSLYRKITVRVDVGGAMKDAMAYAMNDETLRADARLRAPARPADVLDARLRAPAIDYFTVVAQGYRDWNLDPAPLTRARIAVLHARKSQKVPPDGGAGPR